MRQTRYLLRHDLREAAKKILDMTQIQWLAKKLVVSISVIRKLAVVFIPVEIQKFV